MNVINLSQELVELENELHFVQLKQKELNSELNILKQLESELVNKIMAIKDVLRIDQPGLKKNRI